MNVIDKIAPGSTQMAQSVFGDKYGGQLASLPLDALVAPVIGAMSATGPKSNVTAQHWLGQIYGDKVPAWMANWSNWNTGLQPKPNSNTSTYGSTKF